MSSMEEESPIAAASASASAANNNNNNTDVMMMSMTAATAAAAAATAAARSSDSPGHEPPHELLQPVKPALKHETKSGNSPGNNKKKAKGGLKWDEAKIEEHDKLRGTRMKIEEPNTPYHHYDSGSETDGSHTGHNNKEKDLSWDHLENKLAGVAAARDAYPSSPTSSFGGDELTEEQRQKEIKEIQFKEHRKRHYNEMELVRKYRQEHPDEPEDDLDNDADDET